MLLKCLLPLLAASSLSAGGGHHPKPEARIFGGKETGIEMAPWQVSLRFQGGHRCGGSIYSDTIIITAAHCVVNDDKKPLNAKDFRILVGSANKQSRETLMEVSAIKPHAGYDKKLYVNDIAIVKLRKPLEMVSNKVQPIPLAKENPAPGSKALTTGWGLTMNYLKTDHGILPVVYKPQFLRAAYMIVQEFSPCKIALPQLGEDHICAGDYKQHSCKGDSGGPLVFNNTLVGVVSFGSDICTPVAYTSVAHFHEWILKTINSI